MTAAAQYLAFQIPADDVQVPRARRLVRAHLEQWGWPADSDIGAAVLLLFTELVTNAVRHAAPSPVDITITADGGGLGIAVHDRTPRLPAITGSAPGFDATSGRGLSIVAAVTEELGGTLTVPVDRDGGGKTVRVHLPRAAPPSPRLPDDGGGPCRRPAQQVPHSPEIAYQPHEAKDRV